MDEQTMKTWGDMLSITAIIATLTTWLPPVAALLSIIWTLIRIYETKTVQKLLNRKNRPPQIT